MQKPIELHHPVHHADRTSNQNVLFIGHTLLFFMICALVSSAESHQEIQLSVAIRLGLLTNITRLCRSRAVFYLCQHFQVRSATSVKRVFGFSWPLLTKKLSCSYRLHKLVIIFIFVSKWCEKTPEGQPFRAESPRLHNDLLTKKS